MKITKKINHDSLWIKIVDTKTKSEAKLFIGRTGQKITFKATPEMRDTMKGKADIMANMLKTKSDLSYGDLINEIEKNL